MVGRARAAVEPVREPGSAAGGRRDVQRLLSGKLIFALPIGFAGAYKLYILAHVLLAAWAAYRLARHFGASVAAAGICSLSYAFSGSVLFGYCNVVFLVGAAWLPLAVLAADRMLVERSRAGPRPSARCWP